MTTELYYKCLVACFIGNALHIGFKLNSLRIDNIKANTPKSIPELIREDWFAIILDFLGSFVWVFLVDEWLDLDSRILSKIKTLFVIVGFTGSYLILYVTSKGKTIFRKTIDAKTDLLDDKIKKENEKI